jgi:D-alanyl-D-alanine carboxypeptidase
MIVKIDDRLKNWGANKTKIIDTNGLGAGNVSTARDLLKIFTYITDQNNTIRTIMGKKRHDFFAGKQFSISHTNSLNFDNVDYKIIATKTGYTDEAQSVLYLLIQSKKTNKWYSIVTLGDPNYANRFAQSAQIAKWIANK